MEHEHEISSIYEMTKNDYVKMRRKQIQQEDRERRIDYLNKQNVYRNDKLDLVKAYLAVLKGKRRVITWLAMVRLLGFVTKARQNLTERKGYYMYVWSQQVIAIAFKTRFQRRFAKRLGGDVWFREKNRLRRSVTL